MLKAITDKVAKGTVITSYGRANDLQKAFRNWAILILPSSTGWQNSSTARSKGKHTNTIEGFWSILEAFHFPARMYGYPPNT